MPKESKRTRDKIERPGESHTERNTEREREKQRERERKRKRERERKKKEKGTGRKTKKRKKWEQCTDIEENIQRERESNRLGLVSNWGISGVWGSVKEEEIPSFTRWTSQVNLSGSRNKVLRSIVSGKMFSNYVVWTRSSLPWKLHVISLAKTPPIKMIPFFGLKKISPIACFYIWAPLVLTVLHCTKQQTKYEDQILTPTPNPRIP